MTPGEPRSLQKKSSAEEVEAKINFAAEFRDDRAVCVKSRRETTSPERLQDSNEDC
jgi:CCR4-NOT transcriptional regulation complex NOT5 subunit